MPVDVASWLRTLGLERYAGAFAANDIDATALPLLNDEDLKELGVRSLGHRKKLLSAIAELPGVSLRVARAGAEAPGDTMGERRSVTVLFCDIADFTRLARERDAEEIHALLNDYFEVVDSTVKLYGGHVDKHIGDAVMAVFGAPVAHTNDPERAVRAAFDIRRAVAGLSLPVTVHIGLASGSVIASRTGSRAHREYTVTGQAVNLASRLQDLAGAGEILLSEAVHRETRRWVRATARDDVHIKGMREPVRVWRLDGLRTQAAPGPRPAFVGRRAELDRFAELLTALCERGAGGILCIRGEAGIGKSRLVDELRARAHARGVDHHTGLVLDFGDGMGQRAVSDVVCSLLGVHRASARDGRERAARDAIDGGLVPPSRDVYLHDLLDVPHGDDQRARYHAMPHRARSQGKRETLVELVAARARHAPQLIVFEDVHWADADVLGSIRHLGRAIASMPVLLVLTSRIHGDPLAELTCPDVPVTTLDLSPLDPTEAMLLARHVIDTHTRLIHTYVERAGGNPLFLEQLLRNAEELPADSVPDSIQSIVQARIDHLSPEDKHALQAASVMGQRFSLAALRSLLDDPDYTCQGLVDHHLVQPAGDDEYLFAHALVLDGVYSSLLRTRQRQLHSRAAAFFAGRDPTLYAEHLERAGAPGAAQAYLDAARAHAEDYRFERALALCRRAVDLLHAAARAGAGGHRSARPPEPAPAALEYEVTCLMGDVRRKMGDVAGSIRAFEQAEMLATSELDRCRAWLGQAEGMRIVDRNDEALLMLDRAQSIAEPRQLAAELARIHYLRGNLLFPRGDLDGCLAQHTLARDHASRAGSPALEARALSGLGDAAYMRAHMLTAHGYFDRCIELCQGHGLAGIEVANLPMRSLTRFAQLQLDAALDDATGAAAKAQMVCNKRAEILARAGALGHILLEMGRLDQARRELEAAVELTRAVGARRFEPLALLFLGKVLAAQGHRDQGQALIEQSLAVCRETEFSFVGPTALGALAVVTTDDSVRRRALAEGQDGLRAGVPGHNHLYFYADAITASLASGDAGAAERYAGALAAYTAAEPLPWSQIIIASARAHAAYLRDDRAPEHRAALERARARARAAGLYRPFSGPPGSARE